MDLEVLSAEAPPSHTGRRRPRRWPALALPRLDRVELAVLAVFALLSLWILVLDLIHAAGAGRIWTGTDGVYLGDQQQYVAWIRSAAHHFLIANLFVLRPTPADYFQPAVVISAGLTLLGLAPWLALLVWKPVAVLATFLAFRAYVRRSLPGPSHGRQIALVLALFFGFFSVVYGDFGLVGDLMPTFLSWGYTFGLLAIALMVLALLAYDRARTRERLNPLAGVLCAVAALLHPWQGELFLVLIIVGEAVLWLLTRRRPPWRQAALTVALTGAALLYYWLLGRTDPSWGMARLASKHNFSLPTILLAVAPLLVPAALAWRPRELSFLELLTRLWPLAAVAVWLVSATSFSATPLHAFDAITLPLSVLAVQGARRLPLARSAHAGRWAVLAVALLTVPATAWLLNHVRYLTTPWYGNANFITPDEHRALTYLEHDPVKGGVMTRFYLGTIVPAQTGRRTFVGDCLWSQPHCSERAINVQHLFDGTMPTAEAQVLVALSGARFILADCQVQRSIAPTLGPMLVSVRRFGCATLYELEPPASPRGPLAESPPDAALRASWRQ